MTMTFERAKLELRLLGRRYEGGAITIDDWCQGVHDVLAAFQEGADARAEYRAALTAPAAPRPTYYPQGLAAQRVAPGSNADRVGSRMMTGHTA